MPWASMNQVDPRLDLLGRMKRAVENVRDRLERATRALDEAEIPYAVVEGNGIATWVSTIDESAVRNTRDVDILLDRTQLEATKTALAPEGFLFRHVNGVDLFLDGPNAKARDAVHVVFAGEKVREHYDGLAPLTRESEVSPQGFRVLALPALVRMKLTSFRDKDRMHLRDLIDVGLLTREQVDVFSPALAERLRWLFDHPED